MLTSESSPIYLRYVDHVLFRNMDPSLLWPCVREVVGWLTRETEDALYICSDRSLQFSSSENTRDSGFIILKSSVLEMRRMKIGDSSD